MTDHGQTYGEAVEEALEGSIEAIGQMHEEARNHRKVGDVETALVLEGMAGMLARDALRLARKRDRMPFGSDSAKGYGEVMDSPAISLAEEVQRDDD